MRPIASSDRGGDRRWIRLQAILSRVKPGQTVTVGTLALRTGLAAESIGTVLQALTRAQIFVHVGGASFLRESLLDQALGKVGADGAARPLSEPTE